MDDEELEAADARARLAPARTMLFAGLGLMIGAHVVMLSGVPDFARAAADLGDFVGSVGARAISRPGLIRWHELVGLMFLAVYLVTMAFFAMAPWMVKFLQRARPMLWIARIFLTLFTVGLWFLILTVSIVGARVGLAEIVFVIAMMVEAIGVYRIPRAEWGGPTA